MLNTATNFFNKTRYEYIQKIAEKRAQKTVPLLNTATKSNKTRNEYIQKIARKKSTKNTIPLLNTATNFFNKTRNEYIQKIAGKIAQKTILIFLLQPYQSVESCWAKNKQNTIHIAEYFKKLSVATLSMIFFFSKYCKIILCILW